MLHMQVSFVTGKLKTKKQSRADQNRRPGILVDRQGAKQTTMM